MKKLSFLFVLLCTILVNAQEKGLDVPAPCYITGPSAIYVGEGPYTFSIPSNLGQCNNCYDWDITSGANNVSIGFDQNNSVQLNANNEGAFTLRVTYFNENGCHTCSKTFNVLPQNVCSFEPVLTGKADCFPQGGGGNIKLDDELTDLSNVASVTWIFDVQANAPHYAGFNFTSNGQTGITINAPSNNGYNAMFSHNGSCAPQGLFKFDLIITFNNGCPDYYGNDLPVYLQSREPLTFYPNPSNKEDFVSFSGIEAKDIKNIKVLNLSGIEELNLKPTETKFSVKDLSSGLYIIKVITVDGEIFQKQLIIE